jgi:hypothetical protein
MTAHGRRVNTRRCGCVSVAHRNRGGDNFSGGERKMELIVEMIYFCDIVISPVVEEMYGGAEQSGIIGMNEIESIL